MASKTSKVRGAQDIKFYEIRSYMSSYENSIHSCKRDVGHDLTFIPRSLTTIP
jgi:hypothetical protein